MDEYNEHLLSGAKTARMNPALSTQTWRRQDASALKYERRYRSSNNYAQKRDGKVLLGENYEVNKGVIIRDGVESNGIGEVQFESYLESVDEHWERGWKPVPSNFQLAKDCVSAMNYPKSNPLDNKGAKLSYLASFESFNACGTCKLPVKAKKVNLTIQDSDGKTTSNLNDSFICVIPTEKEMLWSGMSQSKVDALKPALKGLKKQVSYNSFSSFGESSKVIHKFTSVLYKTLKQYREVTYSFVQSHWRIARLPNGKAICYFYDGIDYGGLLCADVKTKHLDKCIACRTTSKGCRNSRIATCKGVDVELTGNFNYYVLNVETGEREYLPNYNPPQVYCVLTATCGCAFRKLL